MLEALSEPPLAEGRLAPVARSAFATVAAPSKTGIQRSGEDIESAVRGVVNPLYHLLTYGVSVPGGGGAGSTGAFIADQMERAATKLLASALDVLAQGETTKANVESAKGIVVVREKIKEKLGGGGPNEKEKR